MSHETLSLVSLEVENILRLKAFKMTMGPDGVVVIEAKNEMGKSSAIKTLEMALAGLSEAPPDPLYGDAKKGYIVATFDGLVVKRTFRAGKPPALTVTNADGSRVKAPQTLLDTLVNRACLRPTKLMEASDKEQVAILSEIMGFDSKEFDAEIERIFNCRTDANREAKRLAAVVTATTFHEDAPDGEVSVSDLMAELQTRQSRNAECDTLHANAANAQADYDGKTTMRNMVRAEIADLEKQMADAKLKMVHAQEDVRVAGIAQTDAAARANDTNRSNTDEITTQIAAADDTNRKVRDNIERASAVKEAKAVELDASGYDKALEGEKAKREKARMEARDRLPVPGLDISEDCVLYNGKPFSQAGSSAQLRVSVAVAIAVNKDKRVKLLLIDDAEKLDDGNVKVVLEMAREAGFQVIMARVGDGAKAHVVIEDGEVKDGRTE